MIKKTFYHKKFIVLIFIGSTINRGRLPLQPFFPEYHFLHSATGSAEVELIISIFQGTEFQIMIAVGVHDNREPTDLCPPRHERKTPEHKRFLTPGCD